MRVVMAASEVTPACNPSSSAGNIQADVADPQTEGIHSNLSDLDGFQLNRVLNENSQRKTTFLQGTFKDTEGQAIVILEKKPFNEENITGILTSTSKLKKQFSNDIYGDYDCLPGIRDSIKATVIHPATEKHIKKYESQPNHIIQETPVLYNTITLPFLQEELFSLQWVVNILEHTAEADRIIFEDPDPEVGFILLPDLKWDSKNTENLYLIAIVRKRGIRSLRDVTGDHLLLLKNIETKGSQAIEDKYKLPKTQLRVYIHYQPSFYHLHVHFTNLQYEAPGIYTEKSHLLSAVINNIELLPDYYQKATLSFRIKESDNLFAHYDRKGCVKFSKLENRTDESYKHGCSSDS